MIFVVAGLGFGDEGKGTIVDALVRQHHASLVIRYNGGAQAAHHVVTDDGRSHCFSQFGAGTLAGALTYLSKHVIIDPPALFREAEHLQELGIANPLAMIAISPDCPVVTPYHVALNRLRELSRGDNRHGSCGRGIGELQRDIINNQLIVRASDLQDRALLKDKLYAIAGRLIEVVEKLPIAAGDWSSRLGMDLDWWLKDNFQPDEWVRRATQHKLDLYPVVPLANHYVFEGAQGVLLDQIYGFHPHTTWSDTTFENALKLIREQGDIAGDVLRVGVTRSYLTRHGAGPFPTEINSHNFAWNDHNKTHDWQGRFRVGYLDMPLLKYACAVSHPDAIAVTHLDEIQREISVCCEYEWPGGTIYDWIPQPNVTDANYVEDQPSPLTQWIQQVKPITYSVQTIPQLIRTIEVSTGIEVGVRSFGPTAKDKTWLDVRGR